MPTYEVTLNGQTYDVDAPNEQAAAYAVGQMGGGNAAASAAASAAQPAMRPPPPKRPQGKVSLADEFTGLMANVNRGLGVADEMQAAMAVVEDAIRGRVKGDDIQGLLGSVGQRFNKNLSILRGQEDSFDARRPAVGNLVQSTAAGATAFLPGGPAMQAAQAPNRVVGAARGAVAAMPSAAAYGLADRGTPQERLNAANTAMAVAAPLGAVGGALTARGGRGRPSPQRTLRDSGVSLTPGQRIGGVAKSAEDLAQRAPILGTAIRGARERGAQSLNRAVANRALAPIGEGVPKNIRTGHEAVAHVAERLGATYDDAAKMVPVVEPDGQFGEALSAIQMNISEQPPTVGEQFTRILQNRLFQRAEGRPLSGPEWREAESQIGKLAAEFSASDDGAQRALGDALEEVTHQMRGVLGRINPEAGQIINRANEGWAIYSRLRSAASKASKDGVFTPGQLSTAVRTMDKSVGKGNVAKGQAVLQDLSSAASQVMPDTFGNPGTADAVGAGALGMGLLTAPEQTIPLATGLLTASGPYFMMGRRIVERLPERATQAQLSEAERQLAELASRDPAVRALQGQVQARLARALGVGGASASASQQPRGAQPRP
jgi:hypothetical protein